MKYFIVTYGCQQNHADSERIAGAFEARLFSEAASLEENPNGVKRNSEGEGVLTLLPEEVSPDFIQLKLDGFNNFYERNPTPSSSATIDASGFTHFEFMVRFTELHPPTRLFLGFQGPNHVVYLKKDVLVDATNNPILKQGIWLHIKTTIPAGMGLVKEAYIRAESPDNNIEIRNAFFSAEENARVCSGIGWRY